MMNKELKHVAIAGNIGAGKTTLTERLSRHYGWIPHYESVEKNPYINDFYQDMKHWSFHMQIFFLNQRFKQVLEFRKGTQPVIQDRTIYEDAHIFAPNLHDMGLMSSRDFKTYTDIFETVNEMVQPPDLLIYLRGTIPTLVEQIQKRGREYEDSLRLDYLKKLNKRYEEWIGSYPHPLLVVDIDQLNFAENPEHLGVVINKIDAERTGLF